MGGSVTPAEGRLQKAFKSENAPAMKAAKAQSNEVYSKFQKKAEGGEIEDMSKGAYDRHYALEKEENEAMRNMIPNAAKKAVDAMKGLFGSKSKGEGTVTKTEKSVTVTPAKKRSGGSC